MRQLNRELRQELKEEKEENRKLNKILQERETLASVSTNKTTNRANKKLTQKQAKILKLFQRGKTTRQIAKELKISEVVVRQHKHKIKTKGYK